VKGSGRLAFLMPIFLAGCGGRQSALDAHGVSAIGIKQLIILITAVCSVVWAAVMVALIVALWRHRTERARPIDLEPHVERRMFGTVLGATIATTLIITGFTVASFFTTRALGTAGGDELIIRVRGSQWWWNVEYLDPQPDKAFQTANEIHLPVGRNVHLKLEGDDVIHSFWVPSLAGKQDLIPGRVNELTIRAERAGIYRGQCAEFCGLQHAHMAFLVVAEPQDQFDQLLPAQVRQRISLHGSISLTKYAPTFHSADHVLVSRYVASNTDTGNGRKGV